MTAKNLNDAHEIYDPAPLTKREISTFILLAILGFSINITLIDLSKKLVVEKIIHLQAKDNHRDNKQ